MKIFLYGFVFLFTSLYAGFEEEDMSGIYIEGIALITVVFIMAVITNKISSKHAKEYAIKNKERLKENLSIKEQKKRDYARYEENRVNELLKLVNDEIITEDEYGVIKRWLYN
ncbi:MAG: hypothetical protein L3J10_06520 [Sulfurimonas sp.]|nr:hypothetical protein [Sulfurimonas sp.]